MSLFRRKQDEVPTLQPSDRWISVAGTFAYPDAVKAGYQRHRENQTVGVLVPVTKGQYAGAVSVLVDGHQVGSLPHEISDEFFPIVQELTKQRRKATVALIFEPGDRISICAEPALNADVEAGSEDQANEPGTPQGDFGKVPTFSTEASWIEWPTLLETHQSTVPQYGGHKGPKVPGIIKKYGHLVMVRFEIEPKGRSAGAIQCWVGSTMVCVGSHLDEGAFQAVIESLAEDGLPATCRGTLEHLTDFDAFAVFGKPERRPENAPFLPPEEVVSVDVPDEELQRLDELLHSKAKSKVVHRVGTLVNHFGGTWLSLDGVWTGLVDDEPRACVDQAVTAGFPATCSVVLRRQPYEPLAVTVEIPKSV
jgi:hypothetical protein